MELMIPALLETITDRRQWWSDEAITGSGYGYHPNSSKNVFLVKPALRRVLVKISRKLQYAMSREA